MRSLALFAFAAIWFSAGAQNFSLTVQPVFSNEKITLGKPLSTANGDSLTISTLKFYLGNFEFWANGQLIFAEKNYHLLDLEDENSLRLSFDFPEKTAFDSLSFLLGVDSLTNTAGAMGGDLDPMKGMFWTWQSGYITVKIEGFSSKCPARAGLFEFHLGGYLPPFQTVRRVVLLLSKKVNAQLNFDLAPFLQKIEWQKKSGIMSPSTEAVRLVGTLAESFSWNEK